MDFGDPKTVGPLVGIVIVLTRLEMFLHARKLLEQARAAKAA